MDFKYLNDSKSIYSIFLIIINLNLHLEFISEFSHK